jgi:hypothetical protein
MRAPVARRTRRSNRSRSQLAAAMTARTSSGDKPSGGCQCLLLADRTERGCRLESDSSGALRSANARLAEFASSHGVRPYRTQGGLCPIRSGERASDNVGSAARRASKYKLSAHSSGSSAPTTSGVGQHGAAARDEPARDLLCRRCPEPIGQAGGDGHRRGLDGRATGVRPPPGDRNHPRRTGPR